MTIVYSIMFAISIILLILYCALVHKKQKEIWMVFLHVCVAVVNCGYLLLSLSKTVQFALIANKIAYLGQVFLIMCMFMSVIRLCGFKYNKALPIILFSVGALMFGLIFTTGYLPWYYKEVTLTYADGAAKLEKVYGPLHVTYLIYILLYFTAMICAIVYAIIQKRVRSLKKAGLLIAVVLGNIGMWIVEKFVHWNFEFLSVSYLMSELIFLFLFWMMQDYVHKEDVTETDAGEKSTIVVVDELSTAEKLRIVMSKLPEGKTLTVKEIEVLNGLLDGKSRKEIASALSISENTAKTHISHVYEKLEISNRQDLMRILYQ